MTGTELIEHTKIRMIACECALRNMTNSAASITPVPGTERVIATGTKAEIARLLELMPPDTRLTLDAVAAALGDSYDAEAGHAMSVYRALKSAPQAVTAQGMGELLNADEMAALRRFNETCEDGEGYDVPKEMMQRLAEIGAIYRRSGSYYQFTEFGMRVLGAEDHIIAGVRALRTAPSAAGKGEEDATD